MSDNSNTTLCGKPKRTNEGRETHFGPFDKDTLNPGPKILFFSCRAQYSRCVLTVLPDDETDLAPETSSFNFYFKQEVIQIVNDSNSVLIDNSVSNINFIESVDHNQDSQPWRTCKKLSVHIFRSYISIGLKDSENVELRCQAQPAIRPKFHPQNCQMWRCVTTSSHWGSVLCLSMYYNTQRDLGTVAGKCMWTLSRTKWHWDKLLTEYLCFPLSVSFHRWPTLTRR